MLLDTSTCRHVMQDAVALSDLIVHEAVHAVANATVSTAASEPGPDEAPAAPKE